MQHSVFVVVLFLAGYVEASNRVGNPMYTTADIKRLHSMIQAEDPDVGSTDALTDDAIVAGKFGATPVTLETLKAFVRQRGFSDLGMMNDLIPKVACLVRLESAVGGSLTPGNLQSFISSRELSSSGSKDQLLDRACDYQAKELAVRKLVGKPVEDVTKDDLKLSLTKLGFISTSGTKAELVYRLGQALTDISTIRKAMGDPDFDTSDLKQVMTAHGLSTDGTTSVLLSRLAEYLVEVSDSSSGIPGVSSHCNIITAGSLCVEGGKKVLAPDALPRGLVAKYSFDDAGSLDRTGNGNNPTVPPAAFGPGVFGNGASAYFDGTTRMEIPDSDFFANQDFCVTMWLYLLDDYTGNWRTLVHKGALDHERTPTIFLEPSTRGIEFFVSTTDTSQPAGERLWSNTFVPLRQWTHIAACAEGRNLRLFINGILDAENTTLGQPILNHGPMYVGNDPWRTTGVRSYLDELRYYARSLSADEIQAQTATGLGGVEPTFVELGCMGCSMSSCPRACRRGYQMCSQRDLYGGAYAVARGMGWANAETRVWVAEDVRNGGDTPDAYGLCMCCREDD